MKSMNSILISAVFFWGAMASAFSYVGKFNDVAGVLTLKQVNQTYRASFIGDNGQKGLLKDCESTIGSVLKYKEKDGVLKQIIFSFDPNHCVSVEGRQVVMDFKNDKVSVSVLSHFENYQPPCMWDPQGHQNCPFPESRPVFFSGKFVRQ